MVGTTHSVKTGSSLLLGYILLLNTKVKENVRVLTYYQNHVRRLTVTNVYCDVKKMQHSKGITSINFIKM